jgi:nitrate reductase gamma subunit
MSEPLVSFLENEVQILALTIFGALYVVKLVKLLRLPVSRELTPARAPKTHAVMLAFGSLFMPWCVESTRRHWVMYTEFALFHLGIACAIAATFIFPYAPRWLDGPFATVLIAMITPALVMGLARMVRRISRADMRAISSPDDYFAIVVLTVYLALAWWALATRSLTSRAAFFGLTTFLLLYLPFSKMSHYLYYPFARYFFGGYFGRRGVVLRPPLRS